MKKVKEKGLYSRFRFESRVDRFSHLQYAYDMMIVGNKCWSNIRILKAILLLFKSMSGLKVNFQKSSLVGINVSQGWVMEATRIINYKICSIPFNYIGIPIGANPKRKNTWNNVIEIVKTKLSRWKNIYLTFDGRVVLLKSILYVLPIYFFSFFKALKGIISNIESIFKHFLWGGSVEERKINWISWDKVYRSIK